MNKFQQGYTAIELIFVVGGAAALALAGGAIYVVVHFISKFW